MASKVQMITKSQEFGGNLLEFDMTDHVVIGNDTTEGIETIIKATVDEGYGVLGLKGSTSTLYYRSKEKDGYTRVVTPENWDRNMALWVYEPDHILWRKNVYAYFDGLISDQETVDLLNDCLHEAYLCEKIGSKVLDLKEILIEARDYMAGIQPKKKFASGLRRQEIWKFLFRDSRNYGNMGKIQQVKHKHLMAYSPEYKKRFYAKGKRK